jgi:hypothetical protein
MREASRKLVDAGGAWQRPADGREGDVVALSPKSICTNINLVRLGRMKGSIGRQPSFD